MNISKSSFSLLQTVLRFRLVGYLVVLAAASGCRPQQAPISPEAMTPIDMTTVREWMAGLGPTRGTRYDLRWTFQTQRGSVRGQAALRVEPPDSLRFDYRGPFGRSGATFLAGNEVVWAVPEDQEEMLMQAIPLFWAALGIPRSPPPGTTMLGLETESSRRWQYGVNGDTMAYAVTRTPMTKFFASIRRGTKALGHVEVNYDEQTGLPAKVTLTFPATASLFLMDVTGVDTTVTFSDDVWKRP